MPQVDAAMVTSAFELPGYRIVAGADPLGPSNPLLKHVLVADGAWLDNYRAHPALWLLPLAVLAGCAASALCLRAGRAEAHGGRR